MRTIKDISSLTGRLLVSIPFIISIFHRFTGFSWAVDYAKANGVTWATVFWVCVATVLELIGVISLIPGYKVEFGALSLMLFLVPVTFVFHDYWTLTGTDRMAQFGYFISNTGLTGGLLLLIGSGGGRYSVDGILKKKE